MRVLWGNQGEICCFWGDTPFLVFFCVVSNSNLGVDSEMEKKQRKRREYKEKKGKGGEEGVCYRVCPCLSFLEIEYFYCCLLCADASEMVICVYGNGMFEECSFIPQPL